MSYHHETWVIIGKNGSICHQDDGRLCAYIDEQSAIKACAEYMAKYPNKTFRIKRTKIMLPWL